MSEKGPPKGFPRARPRRPDVGPRTPRPGPRRPDFPAFAVVLEDRVVLRTPFNQEFIDSIKQIPAKLRAFVKDGRPLENALRQHLETHEEYFSSDDALATMVDALVTSIAEARGLSDSWAVALAAPEVFEWALASALKSFPDLQLYDVRVLDPGAPPETGSTE